MRAGPCKSNKVMNVKRGGEKAEVLDKVCGVVHEDEAVMVPLREELLQCVSWVVIKQYLSRGKITSRVNWLNIIHTLLAQLQNVVLCDVSERLSTVVSVLVRVRRCEDGQKTVFVLQELVELLSKMMRFPELKDDLQRVQDAVTEAQCQIVLHHCEWGDYTQAAEVWDLYFHKIHVHQHDLPEDVSLAYWAVADGLKKVISSDQDQSAFSSRFSVESFLVEHSLENFCERIWDLADYVVNKRLHEPRIFKEIVNKDLLSVVSEEMSKSTGPQHKRPPVSESTQLHLAREQQPCSKELSRKASEEPRCDSSDSQDNTCALKPQSTKQSSAADPNYGKQKVPTQESDEEDDDVQLSDDSSLVSTPSSRLPARLSPASVRSRDSFISKKRLQGRKQRVFWSKKEEDYLREGVKRYGVGKWKLIINSYPFHPNRTFVDAKDKWRNMKKYNHV